MDVGNIQSNNVFHRILHPGNGKYVGLTWELRSMHSPEVRKAMKTITGARSKLAGRNKNFSADEIEANRLAVILAATAGFVFDKDEDGEPGSWGGEVLPYNSNNARKILSDPSASWLLDDLDEALGVEKDFFKN